MTPTLYVVEDITESGFPTTDKKDTACGEHQPRTKAPAEVAPVSDGVRVAAEAVLSDAYTVSGEFPEDAFARVDTCVMASLRRALDAAPAPRGLVGFSDVDLETLAYLVDSASLPVTHAPSLAARIRACKVKP